MTEKEYKRLDDSLRKRGYRVRGRVIASAGSDFTYFKVFEQPSGGNYAIQFAVDDVRKGSHCFNEDFTMRIRIQAISNGDDAMLSFRHKRQTIDEVENLAQSFFDWHKNTKNVILSKWYQNDTVNY